MIESLYLRALSHRAIDNATQAENNFTVVTSDIYVIRDHFEYTGSFVTDIIYLQSMTSTN